MRARRPRLILVALAVVGVASVVGGCAFEGEIAVQLVGGGPVGVRQSTKVEQTPKRVQGTTNRAGQVVRIDCSVTGIYDVDDPTGPAVLVQLYVVHLHTRPLPRGTPYQLDCAGPLVVQLPSDVSAVEASAANASGPAVALPAQTGITAIALAFGKRLRAQPGTQFAIVASSALSAGSYTVELAFSLPTPRSFQEKVVSTALIACGRSKYLQPIRPLVANMSRVRPITIQPSPDATSVLTPHLFGGIRAYGQATRTLSCVR